MKYAFLTDAVCSAILSWLGVVMLAYAGGTIANAALYQRYQSWKFEHQIGKLEPTKAAADERLRMQALHGRNQQKSC